MSDNELEELNKEKIWTISNIITLVRILLVPVFVVVLLSPWPDWMPDPAFWRAWQPWVAAIVFAGISFTDAIDGRLARKRNEVTDLGKFMDPLADKILVCAALLALIELQVLPSWVALIILAREFIVSGLRMVASAKGEVIAASNLGKVKTVLQILMLLMFIVVDSLQIKLLGGGFSTLFASLTWLVCVAAVIMTIISLVDYMYKSRGILGLGNRKQGNE